MSEKAYITLPELKELLKKYNIGKKPLSKLLGWGETTILLYCEMENIPENEYSERLYRLYTNKSEYLELLISKRESLKPVAFRKSIRALYKPILDSKILTIAQYIYERSKGNITLAHMDVTLIIAQELTLRFLDKSLFDDIYQPQRGNGNSPYKAVVDAYSAHMFFYYKSEEEKILISETISGEYVGDLKKNLSPEEREIVDYSIDMLSWYGEKAFLSLLAAERFRLFGPPSARLRRNISNETLKKINNEFFDQAKIKKLKDIDGFIAKRIEGLRKKSFLTSENKDVKTENK
ncbi:MAG: hypothetical protein IKP88_14385 [Lachnospiraceae bacterium]|nr:hypothetical protein [Lachnospiraceae bacterium]